LHLGHESLGLSFAEQQSYKHRCFLQAILILENGDQTTLHSVQIIGFGIRNRRAPNAQPFGNSAKLLVLEKEDGRHSMSQWTVVLENISFRELCREREGGRLPGIDMFVRASRDGENMSCLSIFFECSEVPRFDYGRRRTSNNAPCLV
jgi:hypothetical protein